MCSEIKAASSRERKELSDFSIYLGIEEVREYEEEICSVGNPSSVQMAASL